MTEPLTPVGTPSTPSMTSHLSTDTLEAARMVPDETSGQRSEELRTPPLLSDKLDSAHETRAASPLANGRDAFHGVPLILPAGDPSNLSNLSNIVAPNETMNQQPSIAANNASTFNLQPSLFAIPPQDSFEFHALDYRVRENIRHLLEAIQYIAAAATKEKAFRQLVLTFRDRDGFSYPALKRHFYNYLHHDGNWRVLADAAKCPQYRHLKAVGTLSTASHLSGLPKPFVEFWRKLGGNNKRRYRPAYKQLKRLWRAGEDIPGYGTWRTWFADQFPHETIPLHCPDLYPPGWSYANLLRNKPPRPQEVAARIGQSAAREYLPHIIGTRAGLRFLEEVTFDDVKTDFRVLAKDDSGRDQVCDLWLLVGHDKATDMRLAYGLRPAIAREDGSQVHLKLRDMKQLAASLLLRYGLPPYQVVWKVERGTATFSPATAQAIEQLFQGRIQISYSSMIGGTAPSGYKEKKIGNSRAKGTHEAGNNLLHNECADATQFPGQTGPRYDKRPTDLAARENETRDLIKRLAQVGTPSTGSHLSAQISWPLLTLKQAKVKLDEVFDAINHRTDHECEGFEEIIEFRSSPSGDWQPATASSFPEGSEFRTRLESPFERMKRLVTPYLPCPNNNGPNGQTGEVWSPVHPANILHFLEDSHRQVEINKRGEIEFTHEKQSYTFRPPTTSDFGTDLGFRPSDLSPGARFLAYHHPHDLAMIHLTQLPPHNGYVATWPRRTGVPRNDEAALKEAMQYTAAVRNMHFNALNERHAAEAEQNRARKQANEQLLAEHEAHEAQEAHEAREDDIIPIAPAIIVAETLAPEASSPTAIALSFLREAANTGAAHKSKTTRAERALAADADAALRDFYRPETNNNPDPVTDL